jgi:anaerobic selenocysteine-containing dehydrogenase
VAAEDSASARADAAHPFRLISRRSNNFVNSSGLGVPLLHKGRRFNPTYMHPGDLAALGLASGDPVTIRSPHDFIPGVVEADETLKPGVVATWHCFGGLVQEDDRFLELGANVGRLSPNDVEYDPITGIPRMSDIPVSITPGWPTPMLPLRGSSAKR